MPITPLHLGLMAPVLYRTRSWDAFLGFLAANLWIDCLAIIAWFNDLPLPSHDEPHHTMIGALMVGTVIAAIAAAPGYRSVACAAGAYFGAISHIFLDALVHPEMQPFDPMMQGNPLYLGSQGMVWVSILLVTPTAWLIALTVSDIQGYVRRRRQAHDSQTDQRRP